MIYILQFLIFLSLSISMFFSSQVFADECSILVPLYNQNKEHLVSTQQIYVKKSCHENTQDRSCRSVESSIRELQGSLVMLLSKLKSSNCSMNHVKRSPCDRLHTLKQKAELQLKSVESRWSSLLCTQRPMSPPCRALQSERKQSIALLRAANMKVNKECPDPSLLNKDL